MSSRAYKPMYVRRNKNITTSQHCQFKKPIMRLLEALIKHQLPKASHYKRDKEMQEIKKCEKEILLLMDVRFMSKKF